MKETYRRPLDIPEDPLESALLPPATGPLSWRDVYAAVAYSERRVLGAIEQLRTDLGKATDDHEIRVRTLEGQVVTKAAFDALTLRVEHSEDLLQAFRDRETGILGTLKSQRDAVLFIVAIITVAAIFFAKGQVA
jgi:hypothetical protein